MKNHAKCLKLFFVLDKILVEAFTKDYKSILKFFKDGRDWAEGQREWGCVKGGEWGSGRSKEGRVWWSTAK